MQKKTKKIIILTILILIALAIILLIVNTNKHMPQQQLAKQTMNNYTTTIGDYEYDISKLIQDPKDITPTLSAGMIPIKRDGETWIITDKNQKNWYDYANYEPAYMMLNDGVYQSEIVRNMEQNGKKLASENVGVEIKKEELGTIYMWVPRLADDRNNFVYIKQECTPFGSYRTYPVFMSEADKWDYSYAGVWVEYEPLASQAEVTAKVNNLNRGESDETYGFLANTKAYDLYIGNWSLYSFIDRYIYSLSAKSMEYYGIGKEETNVINNTNILKDLYKSNGDYRTVLRVSETNKLEPIKATSYFDTEKEQIIIEVTHNKNPIKEVLFQKNQKLEFTTTTNGKTVANTGSIEIGTGKYNVTVIDIDGNAYEFSANGAPIYATLYTDGTLGISKGKTTISGKTPKVSYGDIQLSSRTPAWIAEVASIKTVNFVNKVQPLSTVNWFSNCTNLTAINNIANLDTSKVTGMSGMFQGCSALTSLDVSNFNTSNVTNMMSMFYKCAKLTTLDVSKFDTSNVIYMNSMFQGCNALTSLNVSNFDTSNVTSMNNMFQHCFALTSLDVSNFDTSNVTNMSYMFSGDHTSSINIKYMSLETLDISNFDTSKVTDMSGMFSCCNKLKNIDVSKWNTSNVTRMYFMFDYCSSLTSLNLSNFDTSNVVTMQAMFQGCSGLTSLNLKSFNTEKVANMNWMFWGCSRLATIYVSASTWVEPEAKENMFKNCKASSVTKQ